MTKQYKVEYLSHSVLFHWYDSREGISLNADEESHSVALTILQTKLLRQAIIDIDHGRLSVLLILCTQKRNEIENNKKSANPLRRQKLVSYQRFGCTL